MPSTEFKSVNRKFKNSLIKFGKEARVKVNVKRVPGGFDVIVMCSTDELGVN